jgi:hypothetical protein
LEGRPEGRPGSRFGTPTGIPNVAEMENAAPGFKGGGVAKIYGGDGGTAIS